jgi:hypothetical protein
MSFSSKALPIMVNTSDHCKTIRHQSTVPTWKTKAKISYSGKQKCLFPRMSFLKPEQGFDDSLHFGRVATSNQLGLLWRTCLVSACLLTWGRGESMSLVFSTWVLESQNKFSAQWNIRLYLRISLHKGNLGKLHGLSAEWTEEGLLHLIWTHFLDTVSTERMAAH